MLARDLFLHCPRCARSISVGQNPLQCAACGLSYYFNPTVSAAAFVFDDRGQVIFLRRAKDPAKGKLTVPGGFIDFGETAEEALTREVKEEVGLEIVEIQFLFSRPNLYQYRDVEYAVCDLIFRARAVDPSVAEALDGATAVEWRQLEHVDPDKLAFPSVQHGWHVLTGR